jgi:hypothetical protein
MQRILVGKCTQQKCDMERFNLMMLNGAKTSNNRGAALKNAYHNGDINRACEALQIIYKPHIHIHFAIKNRNSINNGLMIMFKICESKKASQTAMVT